VNRLNLEVKDCEFVVLVGPSGCGKTTALRMVAGLESATEGDILLDDQVVNKTPPGRRDIAMVFQNYALYPHMRVFDNMAYSLRLRHTPKNEIERRVHATAKLLDIEALLQRWPKQLSGGQRQRVALGRAIVREPRAFLMDEPLSNLDAQLRQEMRRELRELQQRLGLTVVYVTHDQTEAMSMADQVVLLNQGHIEQNAAPRALYAMPATTFAARFIGTPPMNIVALADGAQGAVIKGTQGRAICPGRGEGMLLGVRPEDIELVASGVAATLEAIEYLGADSILACKAGGEMLIVRAQGKVRLAPGTIVQLAWPREAVHIFDAASGKRSDDVLAAARAAA